MNDVISDSKGNDDPNNVKLFAPPAFKAKNQKYHRISNMASFDIKER